MTKHDDKTSTISEIGDGDNDHNILNNTFLIVGIAGGLLAAYLSNSIACRGLLIPTNNAIFQIQNDLQF